MMTAEIEELTKGILPELLNGKSSEKNPILQVLNYRCLDECNGELVQRLTLSDGLHCTTFAVACGTLLEQEDVRPFSIVQLLRHERVKIFRNERSRPVLLVHKLELCSHHSKVIDDPKNMDNAFQKLDEVNQLIDMDIEEQLVIEELQTNMKPKRTALESIGGVIPINWSFEVPQANCMAQLKPPSVHIVKVKDLKNQTNLPAGSAIRVRVMNKMPVKTLLKGKLFRADVADDTGLLKVCAFDEECDRTQQLLHLGHVYWIENGHVRPYKEGKKDVANMIEFRMVRYTNIVECFDTLGFPTIDFSFSPLSVVHEQKNLFTIDVCGICVRASEIYQHGGTVNHRRVVLIDPPYGKTEVDLDIWGQYADQFDASTNPVVLVKNCRVSQDERKTDLFLDLSSLFLVDPPHCPFVASLKRWYADFTTLQAKLASKVEVPVAVPSISETKTIDEKVIEASNFVKAIQMLESLKESIIYVKTIATVLETDPQFLVTLTCDTCKRQVYDLNLEKLVCSSCGYVEGGIIRSLFTRIKLGGDAYTNEWVSISDTQLKKALGITNNFMKGNCTEYWEELRSLVGKTICVKLKFDRNDKSAPCVVKEIDPVLDQSFTQSQLN